MDSLSGEKKNVRVCQMSSFMEPRIHSEEVLILPEKLILTK